MSESESLGFEKKEEVRKIEINCAKCVHKILFDVRNLISAYE